MLHRAGRERDGKNKNSRKKSKRTVQYLKKNVLYIASNRMGEKLQIEIISDCSGLSPKLEGEEQ